MTCQCGHEYEAKNQHSSCPSCGKTLGTSAERDLTEDLAEKIQWFEDWATATSDGRELAARDRDYYNGIQWTDTETEKLLERGQAPIVKNHIFKKVNFILGHEVQNRTDPRALPRTPQHDQDAEAITDALRYVCDDQDFDQDASIAAECQVIEGVGGAIVEHEQDGDEVRIVIRQVLYDRLWWDPHSRHPDFGDAKYLGLSTWMDVEDAVDQYSKREDSASDFESAIRDAAGNATGNASEDGDHEDRPLWNAGNRNRVRIVEAYYKSGGRWYVCHFTRSGFVVAPRPTGYVDDSAEPKDQCPLILLSGYVDRDGNRYGIVRPMIGPQDEINKRSSKALHLLSTRQVWAEDGVVDDVAKARVQAARPDGWVTVAPKSLIEGRIKIEATGDMAAGQFNLLGEAKQEINAIGPEIPQLSAMSGSASGRAVDIRQKLGTMELARLVDNLQRWKREVYRQAWFRVRQFWTTEKWLRVRDDAERTGFRFVGLNKATTRGERFAELLDKKVDPEQAAQAVLGNAAPIVLQEVQQQHAMMMQANPMAQQIPPDQHKAMVMQLIGSHPAMREPMILNDVAQIQVDIVLDETPDVAILQQEEFDKLSSLVPAFLQAQVPPKQLLEMILEASQLRSKRKLLDMLRRPPDEAAMQEQQEARQLQKAMAQAQLQKTGAETAKLGADTQLSMAKAQGEQVDTALAPQLAQAEAIQSQGQGLVHAANAGEKIGGGMVR